MSIDSDSIVYERRSTWSGTDISRETDESCQIVNDILEGRQCSVYAAGITSGGGGGGMGTGTGSDDDDETDDADAGILYMRPRRAFEFERARSRRRSESDRAPLPPSSAAAASELVGGMHMEAQGQQVQMRNLASAFSSTSLSLSRLSSRSHGRGRGRSPGRSRGRSDESTASASGEAGKGSLALHRVRPRGEGEGEDDVDSGFLKDTESAAAVAQIQAQAQAQAQDGETQAPLRWYGHKFFSKELATCRAAYLKIVVRATVLVILLTWASLPIYWGSLSESAKLTGNLETWVINRDQARLGDALEAAVLAAPTSGPGTLWWRVINGSRFPDEESVMQAVVEERTWMAIVVNSNATSKLSTARVAGDDTYDPSSAITVYYAQARNEIATGTYLIPLATAFLNNFTSNYATGSAQRYLAAIVANDGTVNMTALNGIAQAPQTISPGVGYSVVNLRPYTTPEAQALLLVGQIYLCIFAFIIVMAHTTARSLIAQYLTLPSYLILRLIVPLITYIPLSLSYALVSVAFRLPFGAKFTYGGGFMAFFGYVYLGMAALGLALEAMVTVLGTRFVPLFLVILIIVNVSTAVLPPELQSRLYAYGSGFQFWNIQQATRTILFNTYSHLAKNAGLLIAWVLISCCTTSLFTCAMRYREVRRLHQQNRNRNRNNGKDAAFDAEYGLRNKSADAGPDEKGKAFDDGYKEYDDEKGKGKGTWKGKGKNAVSAPAPAPAPAAVAGPAPSPSPGPAPTSALGRWQRIMLHKSQNTTREDRRYRSDSLVITMDLEMEDEKATEEMKVEKEKEEPPDSRTQSHLEVARSGS